MHPFMRAVAVGGLVAGLCAAPAFAVTLTPNAVGGGNIPGTYPIVDFHTGDGNWAPTLKLPASASPGAKITIHADATYASNVVLENTDIPVRSLTLNKGDTMTFTWDGRAGRWLATMAEYRPAYAIMIVPTSSAKLARVSIGRKDIVESVVLPPTAAPGAILIVQSDSTRAGGVSPANVLHAPAMPLGVDRRYVFVFHPELQKWYLVE